MCEFCKNFDWSAYSAVLECFKSFNHAGICTAGGSYRYPVNEQFNYCPVCGMKNPNKENSYTNTIE